MRGDQLSRQWRVLRQLEVSKNGLTANEIATEGGVSLRTAYRDMDDLQLAGFLIYTEKEGKVTRWRLMKGYNFNIPEPFTLTELLCLHLGSDLFNVFKGTVFQESQQSVLEKVRRMLPRRRWPTWIESGPPIKWVVDPVRTTVVSARSLVKSIGRSPNGKQWSSATGPCEILPREL